MKFILKIVMFFHVHEMFAVLITANIFFLRDDVMLTLNVLNVII